MSLFFKDKEKKTIANWFISADRLAKSSEIKCQVYWLNMALWLVYLILPRKSRWMRKTVEI